MLRALSLAMLLTTASVTAAQEVTLTAPTGRRLRSSAALSMARRPVTL